MDKGATLRQGRSLPSESLQYRQPSASNAGAHHAALGGQYKPGWIGKQEESIHLAHVASVKIRTGMLLSDLLIETSGGASPIRCHGHRKADALEMKRLIELHQDEYYRSGHRPGGPADASQTTR